MRLGAVCEEPRGSVWVINRRVIGRSSEGTGLAGMAVNVFGIIVPNQKKITASLLAGRAPDPRLGAIGKQRSVHNNYLTLPVLVMMVSNHYPFLTGHPEPWLLAGLIVVVGAAVRHFLNRHDAGDPLAKIAWTLPVAALALAVAVVMTAPKSNASLAGIRVGQGNLSVLNAGSTDAPIGVPL